MSHTLMFDCRWANQLTNTKCEYEKSVLRQITGHHLMTLIAETRLDASVSLQDPKTPSVKVAAALNASLGGGPTPTMVALGARINAFDVVHVTDFIMICMHATLLFGVVEFLFDEVEPKAIVRQFELVHTRTRTWVCRKTDTLLLVQVGCIECSLWWAGDADNVRVIKPDFMQIRTG